MAKKKKKTRTPYQTYKAYYKQYAKNNLMEKEMLNYHKFRNAYGIYKLQGVSTNIARKIAADQRKYSYEQTKVYRKIIRRFSSKQIDLKGKDLYTSLIQSLLNSQQEDKRTKEKKGIYFDWRFYMSLDPSSRIEYMKDVTARVRQRADEILAANLKNQIDQQNTIADIIRLLHDVYHFSYQEIFSPKEK